MGRSATLCVVCWILWGAWAVAAAEPPATPPFVWKPPATFSDKATGLGLPVLEGVAHWVIYDPLPSKANVDEGGDGRFESLRHGTFNHHQEIVLHEENLEPPAGSKPAGGWRTSKLIVFWTNHSRDENGPGQRVLAKVGTFNADRTEIVWGDDETLVELAPAPVPVRRRLYDSDPEVIREVKASAALRRINGRLYVVGSLNAWHGRTDDVKYHGTYGKPIPAEHWSDRYDRAKGFQWDVAWPLGLKFAQRWKVEGGRLVPDSPLYKMSEPVAKVEVTPGRFKRVEALIEPYTSARPFSEAPAEMQEDVLRGQPERFSRNPKYAPGTSKLAADGKNGLAHHTEFRRPDGRWAAVRDNLVNPNYYYAALKEKPEDNYPPAARTNLLGHAMPVAGELADGRVWLICNDRPRRHMYLTLSDDGITFDKTWLLLRIERETDGGLHKGGGPQYFQAATVGPNIWVVYSVGKEQIGVTKVPVGLLPPRGP